MRQSTDLTLGFRAAAWKNVAHFKNRRLAYAKKRTLREIRFSLPACKSIYYPFNARPNKSRIQHIAIHPFRNWRIFERFAKDWTRRFSFSHRRTSRSNGTAPIYTYTPPAYEKQRVMENVDFNQLPTAARSIRSGDYFSHQAESIWVCVNVYVMNAVLNHSKRPFFLLPSNIVRVEML